MVQSKIEIYGDHRIVRTGIHDRFLDAGLTFIRNHLFIALAAYSIALLAGATAFLLWLN